MGHEFRTPLNGILGMAEVLKSSLNAEQRSCLEVIENSGWRLLKLVKDMQMGIKLYYLNDVQHLIIEVWDTGPGIPKQQEQLIFEPVAQLEPLLSRQHEGPGLGARNLVQLHGGDITIATRRGGGSIFRVSMSAQPLKED